MNKVEAIIRPLRLDAVKEAPPAAGLHGLAAAETKGLGRRETEQMGLDRGAWRVDFLPEVQVGAVLADCAPERADEIVPKAAQSGRRDGEIYVSDVQSAIRIRTGDAL